MNTTSAQGPASSGGSTATDNTNNSTASGTNVAANNGASATDNRNIEGGDYPVQKVLNFGIQITF